MFLGYIGDKLYYPVMVGIIWFFYSTPNISWKVQAVFFLFCGFPLLMRPMFWFACKVLLIQIVVSSLVLCNLVVTILFWWFAVGDYTSQLKIGIYRDYYKPKRIRSLSNQYMECHNQHLAFLRFQQKILRDGTLTVTEPSMAPKLEGSGRWCFCVKILLIFQPLLDEYLSITLDFCSPWIVFVNHGMITMMIWFGSHFHRK